MPSQDFGGHFQGFSMPLHERLLLFHGLHLTLPIQPGPSKHPNTFPMLLAAVLSCALFWAGPVSPAHPSFFCGLGGPAWSLDTGSSAEQESICGTLGRGREGGGWRLPA